MQIRGVIVTERGNHCTSSSAGHRGGRTPRSAETGAVCTRSDLYLWPTATCYSSVLNHTPYLHARVAQEFFWGFTPPGKLMGDEVVNPACKYGV